MAAVETRVFFVSGRGNIPVELALCALGVALFTFVIYTPRSSSSQIKLFSTRTGVWLVIGCALVAGVVAGVSWPNSGDEYSYTYLARTLLEGRIRNPVAPSGDLFQQNYIAVVDGHAFSRYAPGWPALLAVFVSMKVGWLANPMIAGAMAWCLRIVLLRLSASEQIANSCFALAMLTPFTAFNAGSLFPHCFVTLLVILVILFQIDDEQTAAMWRKIMIGVLLGILLNTRYEIFLQLSVLYAADRLILRRRMVLVDGLITALGFMPLLALFLVYNMSLTGNPLTLPFNWTTPPQELEAWQGNVHPVVNAASRMLYWASEMVLYGGAWLFLLAPAAIWRKARAKTLRFYDLMLPANALMFTWPPFGGGHQYGPRYYFTAWVISAITVATSFVDQDRLNRVAAASQAFALGAFCTLLATVGMYIAQRRAVYNAKPQHVPAIVLIPDRELMMWPWQGKPVEATQFDFSRNDLAMNNPVLYGVWNEAGNTREACRLGRHVFVWAPGSTLTSIDCSLYPR